ncbi:MAG: hypothetical protein M3Y77_06890 [Actinomycetota bacterium]|nr:hypothetical protein [Actinomycetota bacterium]
MVKMLGESRRRVVPAEMLPPLTGIVSALFLRAVVAGIFAETALDFLGIGNSSSIS